MHFAVSTDFCNLAADLVPSGCGKCALRRRQGLGLGCAQPLHVPAYSICRHTIISNQAERTATLPHVLHVHSSISLVVKTTA